MIIHRQIGHHRIRLAIDGEADTTPLLLCNGWGGSLEALDGLAAALGPRKVVRFDIPGIGQSPAGSRPLRLHQLATLVDSLCRELGFGEVDVLGFSWGGTLAQEFARRNPERVRRLILAATSPGHLMVPARPRIMTAFADHRWLTNLVRPRRFFERDFACRVAPRLFGGERLRRNPMAILPLLRRVQPPDARGLAWQVAAAAGWTSLHWLHRLPTPTLILAGDDDRVVHPLNARLLARRIPNAELAWLPGGHLFPVLDAVPETAARIGQFLDQPVKVVPFSNRYRRAAG